jgi:hypothetical protein
MRRRQVKVYLARWVHFKPKFTDVFRIVQLVASLAFYSKEVIFVKFHLVEQESARIGVQG